MGSLLTLLREVHEGYELTKATRPLGLPHRKPDCFDSQPMWNEYRKLAEYSANDGFTYCTDCSPERQKEMIAEGRCKYPKTVFVMSGGSRVGRRRK